MDIDIDVCVWFESGVRRVWVHPKLGAEGAGAGDGVEIPREEARLRRHTCGPQ